MTESQHTKFVGVLLPNPLAAALKSAVAQRGQTQSDIIRQALAKDLAAMNSKKPA